MRGHQRYAPQQYILAWVQSKEASEETHLIERGDCVLGIFRCVTHRHKI